MRVEFWRFGASPDVELRDFGQAAARFEDLGWDGLSIPAGIMPGARMSAGPGQGGDRDLPRHGQSRHPPADIAAADYQNLVNSFDLQLSSFIVLRAPGLHSRWWKCWS